MWFGTKGGGVSRYDSKEFVNFTTRDGLAVSDVRAIHRTPDGTMWFGGFWNGESIACYDGKKFTRFTVKDGLASNYICTLYCAPDGVVWVGSEYGVSRSTFSLLPPQNVEQDLAMKTNTKKFVTFTEKDGLAHNWVVAIHRDRDGMLWFGTEHGGVSQYDGKEFVNFTTEDGLASNYICTLYCAPDGVLWFGTNDGVSRYEKSRRDGKKLVNLTTEDGLARNKVKAIHSDSDGILWFGTSGGGVTMCDGTACSSLDTRDGLAGHSVSSIQQTQDGFLWFATEGGITRYRRSRTSPRVSIVSVTTDKNHLNFDNIPAFTSGTRVTIQYNAIDLKTVKEKRQYRCFIEGIDSDWRKPTKAGSFDYTFDKPGTYTFAVQAIDRDLNYSEPASVTLKVVPPWYLNGWIAFPLSGGVLALLIATAFFGSRYYAQRRESQRLKDRMLQQERQARVTLEKTNVQLVEAKEAAESADRAKSTFLANMSHEIRTPLNAVIGFAQSLQRDADLKQHQRYAVSTIENSGNHLLELINGVLELSKIEAGRVELQPIDFNLNTLITELSEMFQFRCEQKGLDWRVEVKMGQQTSLLVHGDGGKLRQVLINLLDNAVKFTESGELVLRVSEEAVLEYNDSVIASMECDESVIAPSHSYPFTFEVIDTGVGIPTEDQTAIFGEFQQGDESISKGGAGLGLAISKRQIELMGGELSVESEPGKGSRFFFTVPLQKVERTDGSLDVSSQIIRLADGYSLTALVADDNKENREVLEQILSYIGVEVRLAENGQEALESVRAEIPDIVFMDIRMPVMDGLEATRRILEEFDSKGGLPSRPCIVAVSASALEHQRKQFMEEAVFDDFIAKPVRAERVYECLANLLHVEYEYKDVETLQIDSDKIVLPENLLLHLREVAEFGSVTELEELLDEVRQIGEHGHLLAEHIHELSQNLDMDAILGILEGINHE